jgi:nucleotide-binding universal stress UspA family protein
MAVAHRRLLVPLTGHPEPERVMGTACSLADDGASVVAVVVIEISPLLPLDARMDDEEAHARSLLGRARAVGDHYGIRVVPRVVRARDAGSAILDLAREEGSELVVLGARRHRVRGVARHVLRKAPCRVLVVS